MKIKNSIKNVEEETLSEDEIEDIKIALKNIRNRKVKPIEQVAKELSIPLKH
jgi:hypothetical protein